MTATLTLNQCTGVNAATEAAQTNWTFMSIDAADSGTDYQTNLITVLTSGTTYSFERWIRFVFTGVFNLIDNIKCYKSAGTYSDGNLSINAGEVAAGVTPVDTASSIATTAIPTAIGSAIDITPVNPIDTSGEKTDYLVTQLVVPDTVVTPGDMTAQTLLVSYDES